MGLSESQIRRYRAKAEAHAKKLGDVSFASYRAERFPITIYAEDSSTGEVLWEGVMEGPGVLDIPPLVHLCSPGAMVRSRVHFATGEVEVWPPYEAADE